MIDAKSDMMVRMKAVPSYAKEWLKLPVQMGSDYLRFVLPKSDGKNAVLAIDTGSTVGVKLRSDLWRKWKAACTNEPVAMRTDFAFGPGITDSEQMWA